MNNKRYYTSLAIATIATGLTAGALAPTIIEKLNENETSKFKKVMNVIGVAAGCFATGYLIAAIIDTNENQMRFVELLAEAGKKVGEA